jgi:RNA polymerase sigma-70 factor (ECF subfamily)
VAADDRDLVRSFLRTGSESAFRALYRAHAAPLYGFALRLTRGDEGAAQDIVQDTWMRAVSRLPEFRWQSSLKSWLHAVALNVYREELRRRDVRQRKLPEVQRRFTVVRGTGPPLLDLERAVGELPAGQREVLLLYEIEGYTHREIAALLEISEGTSKSQLAKARRALTTWFDSEGARLHAG